MPAIYKFVYISYGEPFYVHQTEEGDYCAMVFDRWIVGSTVESVTVEIDKRCENIIGIYSRHNPSD